MIALGKGLVTHARQHGTDITPPLSCLVHNQGGQLQRWHHRISTPLKALAKDVERRLRALVVPRIDGLDVREAVQDLIERLRLPPVCAPARHLPPAFLPLVTTSGDLPARLLLGQRCPASTHPARMIRDGVAALLGNQL